MQREERSYQNILSETVNQADAEINKIKHQRNEDKILMESIIRGIEQEQEESQDNIKSITLSNVINFALSHLLCPGIPLVCSTLHNFMQIRNRNSKSM